ncbi:acyl-CoA dehydrogenase family protein [Pseudonocardia spinosispora]|uniref:acyl-CoA dehydrogenase family protein n=1 Tax=Pseudonocardia spinosispora TaxID=103441 RepID=UPI0004072539|nr:acyl-CoA dehydrogenase family protein [Pseudonocardia spinosispora]
MDLTLTEDQRMIQSTARELLGSRAGAAGVRAVRDSATGYSARLWAEMIELGWNGLAIAEDHGGIGVGWLEVCLLIEEMGAAQVPSPFLSTVGCAAPAIARFGTDAQRGRWLASISSGRVVSYVRAAPDGARSGDRSDVTARPSGDGFVLDGTASLAPYADGADDLLVVASTGAGALTTFLVDAAEPGISVSRLDEVGPERRYRLSFSGVTVSADSVLGPVDGGRRVLGTIEAFGAAATCAEMVGGAQRVLDLTVEYAGRREQFGRPIGSFQTVRRHCADMASDVLDSRLIAYQAIWRLASDLDATAEVSLARSWVADAYQRVCARGKQVHGAAEHDLHLYSAHATSAPLTFGDLDQAADGAGPAIGLSA